MGADYIEPDLVCTADGVLVARHEPSSAATHRHRGPPRVRRPAHHQVVDGAVHRLVRRGPTLAELRTLRAVERLRTLRPANTAYDGHDPVPTFDEILGLRARLSAELGRVDRRLPGAQEPGPFARRWACRSSPPLVDALEAAGLDQPDAPVFVQSFEPSLRELRGGAAGADRPPRRRRRAAPGRPRLAEIADYADAVGADKDLVIPRDADGRSPTPTPLVADAHAAGPGRARLHVPRRERRSCPSRAWRRRRGDARECVLRRRRGRGVRRQPGHRRRRARSWMMNR